jgi:anion-transporting  ArsA/GET3 family ATPase
MAVPDTLLDVLARRQLLVVTGKGGVGKTAVSAILGRAFAERGRRVLVVEVDPRENLHQMLGVPPTGGEILAAGPRLWVQNLKPRQVLDAVVRERMKIDLLANRVLASPIYHHFADGAPGLTELAILGHALRLVRGIEKKAPKLDMVILDAPATGHGVRLLASPLLVADVIRNGPFAEMAGELATMIADPERCGIVAVTLPEEMPVQEVLEMREALRAQVKKDPEALVINGLYPEVPPRGSEADDPLVSLWRRRRLLNERELARLREAWPGPRLELPQLGMSRGPELTAVLQRCLERAVEEKAWT